MPTVIMPKMGDAMEEGTLLRWLKQVGDEVDEGEPIAEIETDKVTLEIEAAEGGVLTKMMVEEGQTVPIGTAIATIGEGDEVVEAEVQPVSETAAAASTATNGGVPATAEVGAEGEPTAEAAAQAPPATRDQVQDQAAAAPPAANARHADADGAAADSLQQAKAEAPGGNGAVEAAEPRTPGERLRASPIVKRLAEEHGIDLQAIAGTGPGGRIVKDDIMPYVTGAKPAPAAKPAAAAPTAAPGAPAPPTAAPAAAPAATGRPAGTVKELSRIRKTTGKRMAQSKQTIPHFYVSTDVDMGAAVAFREQVNSQIEDDASKVSFNDLIVKATALALRDVPNMNNSFEGEQLVEHPNIDVNIAIALDGGLIAPFIPDADQKSLGTISRTAKDLISRAKNGGLQPHEYQGGTFTTSNLGMFDVAEFIAVINPPQAAILAVGSIKQVPLVKDDELVAGHQMMISISADHRAVDGADVAKFLIAVKKYLQNPMLLALS